MNSTIKSLKLAALKGYSDRQSAIVRFLRLNEENAKFIENKFPNLVTNSNSYQLILSSLFNELENVNINTKELEEFENVTEILLGSPKIYSQEKEVIDMLLKELTIYRKILTELESFNRITIEMLDCINFCQSQIAKMGFLSLTDSVYSVMIFEKSPSIHKANNIVKLIKWDMDKYGSYSWEMKKEVLPEANRKLNEIEVLIMLEDFTSENKSNSKKIGV